MTMWMIRATNRNRPAGLWPAVLLLVCWAAAAPGVPYLDSTYGSQANFYLPELNAMGGTGLAFGRGAISNVFNPAYLVRIERNRLDLAFSVETEVEDRYVPLYDSFNSLVTQTAISSNRHQYAYGSLGYAHRFGGKIRPTVAISLVDRYPFDYTFEEELRNPAGWDPPPERDAVIATRLHEVTGSLQFLSLGFGLSTPAERFAFGVSLNYAFGERELVRSERNLETPGNSYNETQTFKPDGVNVILGAAWRITSHWEVGATYESPLTVKGDLTTQTSTGTDPTPTVSSIDAEVVYPMIVGGGVTYRPRSNPLTAFTADVVFSQWTKLKDEQIIAGEAHDLLDTMDYRLGIQHTFYNQAVARFGFRHLFSYWNSEATATFFSAGLGMPVWKGAVDFSLEIGKIVAEEDNLFDYPPDFLAPETSRIEDSRVRFGVGYRLAW